MEKYLFSGVVRPERACLSLDFTIGVSHLGTGIPCKVHVSIICNQMAVWVETDHVWDIFDLKNMVKTVVTNHIAMLAYLKGYAYEIEIDRVLNPARNVDYVFGIGIPCLEKRCASVDPNLALNALADKAIGPDGVYLTRCFNDLASAMTHADDTAFYCYRAIESLRKHCASRYGLLEKGDNEQWMKFRDVAGVQKTEVIKIKDAADPLRHGDVSSMTSDERAKLFMSTWDIVDAYLATVSSGGN